MNAGLIILAVHFIVEVGVRNDWLFRNCKHFATSRWAAHAVFYSFALWAWFGAVGIAMPHGWLAVFNLWHFFLHWLDVPKWWAGAVHAYGHTIARGPIRRSYRVQSQNVELWRFLMGREAMSHVLHLVPAWILLC